MRSSHVYSVGLILILASVAAVGAGASPGAMALLFGAARNSAAAKPIPPAVLKGSSPIRPYRWFPALYELGVLREESAALPGVPDRAELEANRAATAPVLANNQVVAFYGKPDSKCMGILGEYSKEELAKLLKGYAKLYDDANGDLGVVPAFYLIYGTCWPGGEIGYLKDSVVQEYIDFARDQGMLVFIDHQIGKYSVDEAVRRLLPYLKYPNVHIALDPEWRTLAPMQEIGSISAEELNQAQATVQAYLDAAGIPGAKMLVVHQFKEKMIAGRSRVRADYERVLLVHTADGFGSPALKRLTYANNAQAANMPLKGFKLFFKTTVQGAGYDEPLLTPPEVLALEPSPSLIIYQ